MEKKRLFGIILVTPLMAVTWACATRLAKNICFENDKTFKSPSMLVFITSACLFPVFPIYLIISRKGLSTIRDYIRDEKPPRLILKYFLFCFLSWISNYSYISKLLNLFFQCIFIEYVEGKKNPCSINRSIYIK